jgi:diguanylate cyclase (GGDEF)-like protein/PAS domain S-box-containing protein
MESTNKNKAGRVKRSIYRALFESGHDAVLLLDGMLLMDCNQKCLEFFGTKRVQMIGRPLYAFSPLCQRNGEDSRKELFKRVETARGGEEQSFVWTFARHDGVAFDVAVILSLVEWSGGNFFKVVFSDAAGRGRSLELYKIFADNAPLGIYIVKEGKFVFVNSKFKDCVGYSDDELIGVPALNLVHSEDRERVRKSAVRMLKRERSTPYEFRVTTKSGETRWIMETVIPIYFEGEQEVLGNYMDVSENKRAEGILREREERYRTILENIEDGYYELDTAGRFVFFNDSCRKILGYDKDELMGMNCRDFTDKENWEDVQCIFQNVLSALKPDRLQDWIIARKDGFKRHIEASLTPIHGEEGKAVGIRGIIRDVTERKKAEDTITFMAYHDALTGLPNRILFNDRMSLTLAQALRNEQKFVLMMLDLDKFKEINDKMGHEAGDQLLQGVANRLRSRLRKGDTVARMGGDEFMLLFPDIKETDDGFIIAQKIVESFRRPFNFGSHELYVTTSVGVAIYPDDGADFDSLKKHADAAMYNAKMNGRDNFKRNTLQQMM